MQDVRNFDKLFPITELVTKLLSALITRIPIALFNDV